MEQVSEYYEYRRIGACCALITVRMLYEMFTQHIRLSMCSAKSKDRMPHLYICMIILFRVALRIVQ